jgi:WD40 repeat protein
MKINSDQRIEITHDILAREVYARIDASEKMRLKITQFLKDRYDHYRETEVLLSKEDLDYINPYLAAVSPNPEQQTFINESKRVVAAKVRRRNRTIFGIISVLIGAVAISTAFGIQATSALQRAEEQTRQARSAALAAKARQVASENPTLALNLAAAALRLADNEESRAAFHDIASDPRKSFYRQTFEGHENEVSSVAFSPDGQMILTGSFDGTAKLWSSGGAALHTFEGHEDLVTSVAFSPDGQTILTGSWDGTAKLWSSSEGTALQTFAGHEQAVWSVAFSPDGQTILTGSLDGTAKLWSIDGGPELQTFSRRRASRRASAVWSVAFSPDGQTILTGSEDGTVKLWSIDGEAALQTYSRRRASRRASGALATFKGHEDRVNSVAFSPDGQTILTGSWDGTAKLWSIGDGTALQTFTGHKQAVYSVAFSPACPEGTKCPLGDGQTILTGSGDGTAKLWSIGDGTALQTFKGHERAVSSVAFSPACPEGTKCPLGDGQTILTGSWDGTAKLWSVRGGAALHTFEGHEGFVSGVAFSPDGQTILTGSWDGTTKLWSSSGGAALQTFAGHEDRVNSVAFSPACPEGTKCPLGDGQTILTGSDDGTTKLWCNFYHELIWERIYQLNAEEQAEYGIDWAY